MQVVRHDHVRADPRPVFRTSARKIEKSFVNAYSGKNFSPLVRTSCDEINRGMDKHPVQSVQPRFTIFGAHRAPLQLLAHFREPG